MSWDSYIDNLIAQTKDDAGTAHCDKACIIGIDGGGPWTTSEHACAYTILPTEAANIAKCFQDKEYGPMMANGVMVNELKFQFLRVDQEAKLVLAKKKDHGSITMQASATAVVIGHCPEGGQQGQLNKGVAVIAEYLESMNM